MLKLLNIMLIVGLSHILLAQDTMKESIKIQDTIVKAPTTLKGTASFYATKFNNRKTTSGEKFHNNNLTGAHKNLKLGTYVRVRNLKNDSVVVVKINDRLPQKSKRTIDLTQRAAKQLNFIKAGLTKVEITVLDSVEIFK